MRSFERSSHEPHGGCDADGGRQLPPAAGDYRFVMEVTSVGGSTCDVVEINYDFLLVLTETVVSVEPGSWASIKSLYR